VFSIGFSEILLIAVLALLFIKPEKLPGIAREVGKFFGEIKRIGEDFKKSVTEEASAIGEAGEKNKEKPKAAPVDNDNKHGGVK